jgi:RIO kinase 2
VFYLGGAHRFISNLHRFKLVYHEQKGYDGYRLTYAGYDMLALNAFINKGLIIGLGRKIGVGKESDVYMAQNADGQEVVLKFNRLGRTSFRSIKKKRDYLLHRKVKIIMINCTTHTNRK